MIFKIDENIGFDNENILILKGNFNSVDNKKFNNIKSLKFQDRFTEDWRPTITYLCAVNCNLKCKYCYANEGTYGTNHKKKFFDLNDYIETFDYFYKMFDGIKAVSFFGGEPLLNFKQIKGFVEYVYENYPEDKIPEFGLNTNGTIINEEIKEFLKKYKISFGTSIDGTKPLTDKNRIGNAFESVFNKVVNTLEELNELDVHKIVQFTLNKAHIDAYKKGEVKNWLKTLEKLPIEAYEIIPVSTNNEELKIDLSNEEVLKRFKNICEEMADYYLYKLTYENSEKIPRMFVGLMLRIIQREYHQDCSAGYSFTITPDKIIYPCHCFSDKNEFGIKMEDIHSKYDFIKNSYFKEAKNAVRKNVEECNVCICKNICGAWCKGLTYVETNKLDSVIKSRCIMMDILTRKIIQFLVKEYPQNKNKIRENLMSYNSNAIRKIKI